MERYVNKNQKQLRMGITTGTCSAAAAKAAASKLLLGVQKDSIRIDTPKKIAVEVAVELVEESAKKVSCMVVKDSGDDPDVTNRAQIVVSVEKLTGKEQKETLEEKAPEGGQYAADGIVSRYAFQSPEFPWLYLDGGVGVGRVTKKGLEQGVGQAAINTVPRQMIFAAVGEICELAEYREPLLILVSVPKGEELAERTFNPRLGIVGGISILGTSGILEPMSEKAIVDTIEAQIRQLAATGETNLCVTPGNYGQEYASGYLHLDLGRSVKSSNYIGETLDLAVSYGMKNFLLVGNVGKLVKLAAGIMNTHSKTADGRCEIFAVHTVLCGGDRRMAQRIMACINTEEMLELLDGWGLKDAVMESICQKIGENLQRRGGKSIRCSAVLFSEKYGYLGQTPGTDALLREFELTKAD
ncbi:MAG: cobalt-precorrin-5B (C(1))-methyltransferase CbiD [Eubacteriales bacterium]|nr:cobalt-precorrin-5B (C(1))-methyltransferase CbiD [Eubacteriales bacterium]